MLPCCWRCLADILAKDTLGNTGLDSLSLMELMSRVKDGMGVDLPATQVSS
jgi:acyl carrier protein